MFDLPPIPEIGSNTGKSNSLKNLRPQWQKGQSGNPNGRPKMPAELRKKIREMSPAVFYRLMAMVLDSENPSSGVQAARLLLAYAWGAPETASLEDDHDSTLQMAQLSAEELTALARAKMKHLELVKEPEGQGAD